MFFFLLCAGQVAYGQNYQAQDQPVGGNIQVGGNAGNVPVEEGQNNAGYQQAGQQQMGDQNSGDQGLSAFDSSSVPPAGPLPEADWILEIPIDVQGISEQIQKIRVMCQIYTTSETDDGHVRYETLCGATYRDFYPENGAYQRRELIGIAKSDDVDYNEASQADIYACAIRLCENDDCFYPSQDPGSVPVFTRMNPDRPFQSNILGRINP